GGAGRWGWCTKAWEARPVAPLTPGAIGGARQARSVNDNRPRPLRRRDRDRKLPRHKRRLRPGACRRSQNPTPTKTSATTTHSKRPPSQAASRQKPVSSGRRPGYRAERNLGLAARGGRRTPRIQARWREHCTGGPLRASAALFVTRAHRDTRRLEERRQFTREVLRLDRNVLERLLEAVALGLVVDGDFAAVARVFDLAADGDGRQLSPHAQEALERRPFALAKWKLLAVNDDHHTRHLRDTTPSPFSRVGTLRLLARRWAHTRRAHCYACIAA